MVSAFSRRFALWPIVALAALAMASCAGVPSGNVTGAKIVSDEAIAQVNAFRLANGEAALRIDRRASRAALAQANTMAAHQEMEHNIGFGANFARRMKRGGVPLPAAENIANGQRSVGAAVTAWENSPPHRKNMLGRAYKGVGVAAATDAKSGRIYWAMVLTGG